tara:strand:+ start:410 stop:619 length:210 start_codon:yes stop_codon:yes gene_type:complete
VARREVPALIAEAAERAGVVLGDADISGVEPTLESIDAFVASLKSPSKKKSSGKGGSKQESKSDEEVKE